MIRRFDAAIWECCKLALSATLVGEVRTAGADTNGGFYKTGASGTDYSQQSSAQFTGTNLTVDPVSNAKVTPDGHTPAAADVGNTVYIASGIGWTVGLYEITAQDGVEWTLDRSPAAIGVTGGVWAMGGAKASPGGFGRDHVAGNDGWIAGGTYTVTSATANIAAGCVTLAGSASASNQQHVEGYASSRGDKGTFPIIKANGVITTFVLVTMATASSIENLEVDGNSRTSSTAISTGGSLSVAVTRCRGKNCTASAFLNTGSALIMLCEATGCSTSAAFSTNTQCWQCVAHDNTATGFSISGASVFIGCVSCNNSGASSDGFASSANLRVFGCTAYNNGRDGFRSTAGNTVTHCVNCIADTNAGTGFNVSAAYDGFYMLNCAYRANGTNVSTNITSTNNVGGILLTADPFVSAAGNNFALNTTAGGGAALRAAGIPTASGTYALMGISTASYPDVGAAQHADPATSTIYVETQTAVILMGGSPIGY